MSEQRERVMQHEDKENRENRHQEDLNALLKEVRRLVNYMKRDGFGDGDMLAALEAVVRLAEPEIESRDGFSTRTWCIANPSREAKLEGLDIFVRWVTEWNDFRQASVGSFCFGAPRTHQPGAWRPADGLPW